MRAEGLRRLSQGKGAMEKVYERYAGLDVHNKTMESTGVYWKPVFTSLDGASGTSSATGSLR